MTGIRHVPKYVDSRMVVTRSQAPCKQRTAYWIDGITSMERALRINDPDVGTLATALLERMYRCKVGNQFVEPICPERSLVERRLKRFKRRLLRKSSGPLRFPLNNLLRCTKVENGRFTKTHCLNFIVLEFLKSMQPAIRL